jgi:hypothetical protein
MSIADLLTTVTHTGRHRASSANDIWLVGSRQAWCWRPYPSTLRRRETSVMRGREEGGALAPPSSLTVNGLPSQETRGGAEHRQRASPQPVRKARPASGTCNPRCGSAGAGRNMSTHSYRSTPWAAGSGCPDRNIRHSYAFHCERRRTHRRPDCSASSSCVGPPLRSPRHRSHR